MSIERNMRRITKRCKDKGKEIPAPNYHIAHKKARKHGTGVKYSDKAGVTIITKSNVNRDE